MGNGDWVEHEDVAGRYRASKSAAAVIRNSKLGSETVERAKAKARERAAESG
ncbi:MAG: hypothetical protein OXJ53_07295 [Gammaproteobacteria bacterium]|nr:hypothetical protein [Gammaproteobacteria bacterium]MDE0273146.1 hypothetical protein [Gammaproteobacteria bacterium]